MERCELPTIFIADDDHDNIEMFMEAAQRFSNKINYVPFENGQVLVTRLSNSERLPELIILDLHMPVMDGFDTLKVLRSDCRLKSIPVVLFSTSFSTIDEAKCRQLGCERCYDKPVSFPEYMNAVQQILSHVGNIT